jgi:multicomponent Na+:H+ antiporter subunit D
VPASAFAALVVLCVPVALIGLYPEPLIEVANAAVRGLLESQGYIGAVFPGASQ